MARWSSRRLRARDVHERVREGQPHASFDDTEAAVVEIGGLVYVTFTTGNRRVAVFRVRHDGKLRRLVRVPRELETDEE